MELFGSIVSAVGSAISGGFSWGLAKLGLNNSKAEQASAAAQQDQTLKDRVTKDQANPTPQAMQDLRDIDAE